MKYVVWTIICFIMLTVLYSLYDSFKSYLFKKYSYEFYNDGLISSLIFSLVIGGLSIGLNYVGIPFAVFSVMLTISIIAFLIVLINNIIETAIIPGILVTLLQSLFSIYLILMLAIIKDQLENIFSPKARNK